MKRYIYFILAVFPIFLAVLGCIITIAGMVLGVFSSPFFLLLDLLGIILLGLSMLIDEVADFPEDFYEKYLDLTHIHISQKNIKKILRIK